jgi:hypothetical protein
VFYHVGVRKVLGGTAFLQEALEIGPGFPPGFAVDGVLEGQADHHERGIGNRKQAQKQLPAFGLIFRPGRFHEEPGGIDRGFPVREAAQQGAEIGQGGVPVMVALGLNPGPEKEIEGIARINGCVEIQGGLGLEILALFHQDMGPHEDKFPIPGIPLEYLGDGRLGPGPVPVVIPGYGHLPLYTEVIGKPDYQILEEPQGFLPLPLAVVNPRKSQCRGITFGGKLPGSGILGKCLAGISVTFKHNAHKVRGQDGRAVQFRRFLKVRQGRKEPFPRSVPPSRFGIEGQKRQGIFKIILRTCLGRGIDPLFGVPEYPGVGMGLGRVLGRKLDLKARIYGLEEGHITGGHYPAKFGGTQIP